MHTPWYRRPTTLLHLFIAGFLFIYTFPLLSFRQHLVGVPSDPLAHAWVADWFCDHFFTYDFINTDIFAPDGINMANSYPMPLLHTIGCIASPWGGIAILNTIAIIQMVLIFLTTTLVAHRYLNNPWLKLGFIFLLAFCSLSLSRLQIHLNILSTVWGTALTFYLFDRLDLTSRRSTLIAFVGLTIVFLSAWQNIANLTFFVTILLIRRLHAQPTQRRRQLTHILMGSLLLLVLSAYFIYPVIAADSQAVYDTSFSPKHRADIISYLTPPPSSIYTLISPASWHILTQFEQIISLDPLVILLTVTGIISLIRRRYHRDTYLLLIALLYLILSFGPFLRFLGTDILPLPYYPLLAQIPPLLLTRSPARFSIILIFTLTLFALRYAQHWCATKPISGPKKHLPLLIGLYAVFMGTIGNQNLAYPTYAYQDQLPLDAIRSIAADTSDTRILHIPHGTQNDQLQVFYQLFHRHPLITGYSSYRALTPSVTATLDADPVLRLLSCESGQPTDTITPQSFAVSMSTHQIGYIILNPYLLSQTGCEHLASFVETQLPTYPGFQVLHQSPTAIILRISTPPTDRQ